MNYLAELSTSESVLQWDRQIRLFAKYFLAHVALPSNEPFKLLDVGCGTGSALTEIRKQAEKALLHGCDIEDLHVDLARYMNPEISRFFRSDIAGISSSYDYIYASNILELIHNWQDCLMHLCALAPVVFVLLPYREDLSEQLPSGVEHVDHLNSYDEGSLSFLDNSKFSVQSRVIRTPYAWGFPMRRELAQKLRRFREGKRYTIPREIIFMISRRRPPADSRMRASFRSRIGSEIRSMIISREAQAWQGTKA